MNKYYKALSWVVLTVGLFFLIFFNGINSALTIVGFLLATAGFAGIYVTANNDVREKKAEVEK